MLNTVPDKIYAHPKTLLWIRINEDSHNKKNIQNGCLNVFVKLEVFCPKKDKMFFIFDKFLESGFIRMKMRFRIHIK